MPSKDLPDLKDKLASMAKRYIDKMEDSWKRYTIRGESNEAPKIITHDKCIAGKPPYDDVKGQPGFDRLCVVLPSTVSKIILFPPVKGSSSTLQIILDLIDKEEIHTISDAVILFAPPFYGTDSEVNKNLLANFLDLSFREKTSALFYILTQNTDANKMVGCQLSDRVEGEPILNMLEPSYVIYPFARTYMNNVVGNILFTAAAANEVNLPSSNIRQISSPSTFISSGKRGALAYPPNIIAEDKLMNKNLSPLCYRFTGEKAHTFSDNFMFIRLKRGDNASERRYDIEMYDKFVPSDEDALALDGVSYERVTVSNKVFSIRKPNSADVKSNWYDLKFTIDESNLLEELQIKPKMLKQIFGASATSELVDFLINMVNSKCYTDRGLLTNEECAVSEKFIDKIYENLLAIDPRIDMGLIAAKQSELRLDEQEDRVEEAEADADEIQNKFAQFKLALNLDESVTLEDLQKDPFENPYLVKVGNETPSFDQIFRDIKNGKYYIFVTVSKVNFSKDDTNDQTARLYVDASNQDEAEEMIESRLDVLIENYPGYKMSIDPGSGNQED